MGEDPSYSWAYAVMRGGRAWYARLGQVIGPEALQQGKEAALPEGVAAVHQLVGAPHEAAFHCTLYMTTHQMLLSDSPRQGQHSSGPSMMFTKGHIHKHIHRPQPLQSQARYANLRVSS